MNNIEKVPEHIAIIMDGNRRWAKKQGVSTIKGHKAGSENFKKIARKCYKTGVKYLTVYAFSTENWKRNKEEVSYLMKIFSFFLKRERNFLIKNKIKLKVIGQVEKLSSGLKNLVRKIEDETKNNKGGILNLAISYGGRMEIIDAVKKIIKKKISPEAMDEETFSACLYTAGQPDPDLLIRTGGEQRLSGFLPWQSVYSELYFSEKLWPDFSEDDLGKAIKEFQRRQRRFGK